ncbi:PREDICTED: lethal(3)malignant brain tumor-like protein 3 isoform X2 [Rhagoletis zephyria]|uniref:lethal(3)malignant brain tumor-like protein 3 isoform X2 n=1 Tax=Rhagoletis zephyria TaxID=28612 RepID=UPI0008112F63|nr:PREDICTED: lethal(3)malignant brain tumor-like protein 3 isoform X2 [Rhagoletis zephyria]
MPHDLQVFTGSRSRRPPSISSRSIPNKKNVLKTSYQTVIPASILIRNRQQYQSQGNTKTTACAAVRSNVDHQAGALTILDQEIVKQIVVGSTSKNSVITQASSSNANIASNSSQTLLKSPSITGNVAPVKHQDASNKTTTLLTQAPVIPTTAATSTTQTLKKQYQQLKALHSTSKGTSILQSSTTNKLPLSETVQAAAGASSGSSLRSIRRESGVFNVDLSKDARESIPPPVSTSATSVMETSNQTNVSVIKTHSAINPNASGSKAMVDGANFKQSNTTGPFASPSGSSSSFKVEIDLTKPVLVQAKLVEKQESLLKSRPTQQIIECSTSPRSKRSKSLSCAFKEVINPAGATLIKPKQAALMSKYILSERRHSTASEGKMLKQKSSPPRRKQTLASMDDINGKEYTIIDLIDYTDEEHGLMDGAQQKLDSDEESKNIEPNKDEKNMEEQNECENELKTPSTQAGKEGKPTEDNNEENILKDDTSVETLNTHTATAITTSDENASEIPINTGYENEHIEEASLKIEIIMDEDDNSTEPQPAVTTETEDILSKDAKGDDTQTSVEHTQDSLEKSLYCDEKISLSSTSSASTSSSRQSLHDDIPTSSNAITSKSTALRSNQPSTSAAAGIASTAMVPTTSSEDSLSSALKMLASFNMLTWNQRIGGAHGTNMRFQLNEFNLIEINERCSPRTRIHAAYEKPIYERESAPYLSEKNDGLLYLCRRCNCHGPALDFLAPEFCSLDCLKRESRKRRHEEFSTITRKRKNREISAQPISTKSFRWSTYLPEKFNAIAAPVNLFINPFPTGPNRFQIGMKLEAIDPENCSLFCVCTIVDIQGYRLKLTFDGCEYMYDFWVNADSMDIFPPGWCTKTKRVLQPPKGKTIEEFFWPAYLQECKAIAAQRILFTHLNASFGTHNPFKIGMHLEAEDLNDTGKLCVASVSDVLDNRIRVHFDGWDDCYDYWVDISSPYIHPCGWHVGRQQLIVPPEFENTTFTWTDYIKNHGSGMAATEEMFSTRDPIDFKPNMKLEVVDPRNPSLIRPATVVGRKGHRVKLHLDCWASNYCFWLEDDSADLHPIGWCEATGHELEPPPGYKMRSSKIVCSTFGCRGIGNAKRLYLNTHTTQDCCPYAPENWRQKVEKPPRLEHEEIIRPLSRAKREMQEQQLPPQLKWKKPQTPKQQQPKQQLSETHILQRIQLLDNIKTRHVNLQEKQQQKQTVELRAHRISTATATTQQQSLIKTEHTDKPSASALRAHHPVDTTSAAEESTSLLLPQIKIAKEFLCDYGPRLQQNYNIWQRNVAFDMQRIKRNPLLWTTKDSCAFVQCVLRNSEATESFLCEDIDGSALLSLQQSDLTEILRLKLGPAVKLYSCILQLRTLAVLKFDVKMGNAPSRK